jgi:hypothetical protein
MFSASLSWLIADLRLVPRHSGTQGLCFPGRELPVMRMGAVPATPFQVEGDTEAAECPHW